VLVEFTDQSIYFEYDTAIQAYALCLTYADFEHVYNNLTQNNPITTEELTIQATPEFIHIISDVLTVSFDPNDLEKINTFYTEIKSDLQDPGRKAICVWENDSSITETRYASDNAVSTVVENLQSKYSDEYTIEVIPVAKFQNQT